MHLYGHDISQLRLEHHHVTNNLSLQLSHLAAQQTALFTQVMQRLQDLPTTKNEEESTSKSMVTKTTVNSISRSNNILEGDSTPSCEQAPHSNNFNDENGNALSNNNDDTRENTPSTSSLPPVLAEEATLTRSMVSKTGIFTESKSGNKGNDKSTDDQDNQGPEDRNFTA